MIEVKMIKDNENFKALMVTGHANTAEYGRDLLCASTTCLSMSLVNYLTEVVGVDIGDLDFHAIENPESSILSINITDKMIYEKNEVQDGFKFFEVGIKSLCQDYSEYLELIYREV